MYGCHAYNFRITSLKGSCLLSTSSFSFQRLEWGVVESQCSLFQQRWAWTCRVKLHGRAVLDHAATSVHRRKQILVWIALFLGPFVIASLIHILTNVHFNWKSRKNNQFLLLRSSPFHFCYRSSFTHWPLPELRK